MFISTILQVVFKPIYIFIYHYQNKLAHQPKHSVELQKHSNNKVKQNWLNRSNQWIYIYKCVLNLSEIRLYYRIMSIDPHNSVTFFIIVSRSKTFLPSRLQNIMRKNYSNIFSKGLFINIYKILPQVGSLYQSNQIKQANFYISMFFVFIKT